MTKKTRSSLILLYCLAIFLLFLPFMKQVLIIYQTEHVAVKTVDTNERTENVPLEAVQPPDLAAVLAFENKQTYQATGQIILPKVDIDLPVFTGVTDQQMLIGAGTLFPERTPEKQNVVVIGHHLGRNNLLFGQLLDVKVGESVYLSYQGEFYQYIINQTKIIQQTELNVLDDRGKAEITLITCDKPTRTDQRFVAKGQLVRQPSQKSKERVLQQREAIQKNNKRKNRSYCVIVIALFLLCLVIGIRIITKISQ